MNVNNTRKILAALAPDEDRSVTQIVVRSGLPGLVVEAQLDSLESGGLVLGVGPAARRRYRLADAGRTWPTDARHDPFPLLCGILWSGIRRLREFRFPQLEDLVAGSGLPFDPLYLQKYVYALVRAGLIVRVGCDPRPAGTHHGHGPTRYRLPDDRDPGPLPPIWDRARQIVFDPNRGTRYDAASQRRNGRCRARLNPDPAGQRLAGT